MGRRNIETQERSAYERLCQPVADGFYQQIGCRVDRSKSSRQYDVCLHWDGGLSRVEEKFERRHSPNLIIELLQCVKDADLGWYADLRCDSFHHFTGINEQPEWRLVEVNWHEFEPWFYHYLCDIGRPSCIVNCEGYGVTLSVLIPYRAIPRRFCRFFVAKAHDGFWMEIDEFNGRGCRQHELFT